jgi:hypothetical protein
LREANVKLQMLHVLSVASVAGDGDAGGGLAAMIACTSDSTVANAANGISLGIGRPNKKRTIANRPSASIAVSLMVSGACSELPLVVVALVQSVRVASPCACSLEAGDGGVASDCIEPEGIEAVELC